MNMLSCFICGTWLKPDKNGIYKCKKCKAKWKQDEHGNMIRIYDNDKATVKENSL